MSITLSPDQQAALDSLIIWMGDQYDMNMTLGGYAGTGKTTILTELCRRFPSLRIAMVSLTGKAVSVMESKRDPNLRNVFYSTIHSLIYYPIINSKGVITGWEMRPKAGTKQDDGEVLPVPRLDLIINDEASMTSRELFEDLSYYDIPILFVGDHGQLPPIESGLNLMENPRIKLEKIHRQAADNPIIQVATEAREKGYLRKRRYSDTVQVLSRSSIGASDILDAMNQGDDDSLIIVSTNSQRVKSNLSVCSRLAPTREILLKLPQATLFQDARLICLRNDKASGLFNGQLCTLKEIHNYEDGDKPYIDATVMLDSGKKIRVCMSPNSFNVAKPGADQYSPYTPFDFGYAVTCHKAQGSQARRVFVNGSGFGDEDMRRRWIYTAVTRAEEELYVLQK